MKNGYTPGPWEAVTPNPPELWDTRIFAGTRYIGMIGNSDNHDGCDEANARLMASSPELLEALRDAEFLLRKAAQSAGPMQDSFNRSAEDARAAIAKATGREV